MSDDIDIINADLETLTSSTEGRSKRLHILVQPSTHAMLEAVRVLMRRGGVGNAPPELAAILEREWTSDVLVQAGCVALRLLLTEPRAQVRLEPPDAVDEALGKALGRKAKGRR